MLTELTSTFEKETKQMKTAFGIIKIPHMTISKAKSNSEDQFEIILNYFRQIEYTQILEASEIHIVSRPAYKEVTWDRFSKFSLI